MADFEEPDPEAGNEPTDLEPTDLEPEEFDPDSLGPDPPDIAANAENADPETARLFWALVMVFNLALLGLSVGAMFIIFLGDWTVGGQLMLGGGILFTYGYYRYRTFTSE